MPEGVVLQAWRDVIKLLPFKVKYPHKSASGHEYSLSLEGRGLGRG
jgi:hypothetical protein